MNKQLIGLGVVALIFGGVGSADATFILSDVGITANSVTFTIDGDMTGYTAPPSYVGHFSIEYIGDFFLLSPDNYYGNTWSTSVFDNKTFAFPGYTGAWGQNYTWAKHFSSLVDATATSRTITLSTSGDILDNNATGQLVFNWGHPYESSVELARINITPTPTPEPATMLLFGTGLVGLVGSRLRKKKK